MGASGRGIVVKVGVAEDVPITGGVAVEMEKATEVETAVWVAVALVTESRVASGCSGKQPVLNRISRKSTLYPSKKCFV
jgi:hypothetical protein